MKTKTSSKTDQEVLLINDELTLVNSCKYIKTERYVYTAIMPLSVTCSGLYRVFPVKYNPLSGKSGKKKNHVGRSHKNI